MCQKKYHAIIRSFCIKLAKFDQPQLIKIISLIHTGCRLSHRVSLLSPKSAQKSLRAGG